MFVSEDEKSSRSIGKFPYKMDDHSFLMNFNKELKHLEETLLDKAYISDHPNVFILGLPRSGTTLISQIIFNHTALACTNNLMARFWDAPLCGTLMSRILLGETKSTSYNSSYAATNDIVSPHEFGYFWRKHFLSDDITTSYPAERITKIDWAKLRSVIYNINRIFDKGLVLKTLEISGYYLTEFINTFPKSIYIYIERDNLDTAVSIAKARLEFYNNLDKWWGIYPLEYNELRSQPFEIQIAGQIHYLKKMYHKNINDAETERIIKINYSDLCSNPGALIKDIVLSLKKNYDYKLNTYEIPCKLKLSKPNIESNILDKLKDGLQAFNLNIR